MNLFNANFLFASLIWGSIGFGYCIYGKKQGALIPLIGGIAMVAASYLIGSALLMSLVCVAVIVVVYWLVRQGY